MLAFAIHYCGMVAVVVAVVVVVVVVGWIILSNTTSFLLSPRTVFILRFTVLGGNHFRKDGNALPKMH